LSQSELALESGRTDGVESYSLRWLALGVLAIGLLLTGLDTAIITIAIPSLTRTLHSSLTQVQWFLAAYVLVFASLQLGAGVIGDRLGRRGVLNTGLLLFAAASLGSAFSRSAAELIGMRALMGVGAALILPTSLALVLNIFPPHEHQRAIAAWSAAAGIGIPLGPLLGGWLLTHYWWGSIFLINIPLVLVAIVAGHFFVPTSRNRVQVPFDFVGISLSVVGLAVLLYGIIEAPNDGWDSPKTILCLAGGMVILGSFTFWESRTEHPCLDIKVFAHRGLSVAAAVISMAMFALYGVGYFFNQYLQFTLGYSPFQAGLRTVPIALGLMIGAPASVPLSRRIGTRGVLCTGLGTIGLGLGLMTILQAQSTAALVFMIAVILGGGIGLSVAPATASVMATLPTSRAGVGAAINTVTRETGGALGIAVLGSILTWQYGKTISTWMQMHGVVKPIQGTVRASLGGALSVAHHAPSTIGPALAKASNAAFLHAIHVTVLVGLGVVTLGIALAGTLLPPRGGQTDAVIPGQAEERVERRST
jgi:EmrB/QacA subfamily drug resistance transporter